MYFMIIFDASVFPAPLSPEKKEEIQQNTQLWQTNYKRIILSICIINYSCLISPFLSASAGLSLGFQVARYIKVVGVNWKAGDFFWFYFPFVSYKVAGGYAAGTKHKTTLKSVS